ncbi:MAG: MMPL family transporter, partial [Syntrophobacteraceae bacterium]
MLSSWGRWVYRFRWWIIIVSLITLIPSVWLAMKGGHLESEIVPARSESARALDLIKKQLPPSYPSFGLIFRSPTLTVYDPAFKAELERALEPLRKDPRVKSVQTVYRGARVDTRDVSRDGRSAIVTVEIKDYSASETDLTMKIYPALRSEVHSNKLEVLAFGALVRGYEITTLAEKDARQAELRALPFIGLLLLFVFGSVMGAALPLVSGLLAVTAGIAGMLLLARITPVLAFARNVVVMVGLGVAIDYSLFILSRFRRQVRIGTVAEALAITMATSGQAVLFSGTAVAVGLLSMFFLGLKNVGSMGLSGAIVVVS